VKLDYVEKVYCLRIENAAWFEREDFQRFVRVGFAHRGLATWWRPGTDWGDEFNDVFMTYEHGGGSDTTDIPADIWDAVCKECRQRGMDYGVVWIVNCPGAEEEEEEETV
jgi:hypothetical protein